MFNVKMVFKKLFWDKRGAHDKTEVSSTVSWACAATTALCFAGAAGQEAASLAQHQNDVGTEAANRVGAPVNVAAAAPPKVQSVYK